MPRTYRHRPGTTFLHQHGVSLRPIADALDVSTVTVSRWLGGRHTPEKLFPVVAALTSRQVADELRAVIEESA